MANKFKISEIIQQIESVKDTLPVELGAQGARFFVRSWNIQGFDDDGIKKWDKPQRQIQGTAAWKAATEKQRAKPIEVQTGALRRAVSTSLRTATFKKVQWVVPLPYAQIQNEGGNLSISEHSRGRYTKYKTTQYTGLKKSKKTGKFYMAKSVQTNFLRTGETNVKAHSKTIPARPFMQHSGTLQKMQMDLIQRRINKTFKVK